MLYALITFILLLLQELVNELFIRAMASATLEEPTTSKTKNRFVPLFTYFRFAQGHPESVAAAKRTFELRALSDRAGGKNSAGALWHWLSQATAQWKLRKVIGLDPNGARRYCRKTIRPKRLLKGEGTIVPQSINFIPQIEVIKLTPTQEEAEQPGFLESIISTLANSQGGRLLQFAMAGAPAPKVVSDKTETSREALNTASLYTGDVKAVQRSLNYTVLPCIKFNLGAKGSPNTGAGLPTHDEDAETKGSAVRFDVEAGAGRYSAAYNSTVARILKDEDVTIDASNALLYEVEDINSKEMLEFAANVLLANGYVTISRGFAVKAGTPLATAMVALSDEMFKTPIEQRGYQRSTTTTPNVSDLNDGLPVFVGKLIQLGWFGNDGGAVFTAGLMRAFQNRVRQIGLGAAFKELFKGLATAAKIVARWDSVNEVWMPHNYALDTDLNKAVKATVKKKVLSPIELLNTASAEQIALVTEAVGSKVADRIVAYREAHGDFTSFDELTNVKGVGSAKAKAVEDNILATRYSFIHEGTVYSVGLFLDESQAKGRKSKLPDVGLVHAGNQGAEIFAWAIALDSRRDSARISLGWQVTQLLSEVNVYELLKEGSAGRKQLEKLFEDILGRKNGLLKALMVHMDGKQSEKATKAAIAMAMMAILGKKLNERISSGLGAKAKSHYIQMMDLGAEIIIDRLSGGAWQKKAFIGRTPNQGHETIRCVQSLDVGFVAEVIKQWFATDSRDLKDIAPVFDAKSWSDTKKFRAAKFIADIRDHHGSKAELVLEWVLAFLPTVAEGAVITDTALQETLCGDNDGDRNMISYSPLLVQLAEMVTQRHPNVIPAKEQSKAFVVPTFAPIVKMEGGFKIAYEKFLAGNKEEMREVQLFLNAPGNAPGQDNVGAPTLIASAPMNLHPWVWVDGTFGPKVAAARHLMDYYYMLQQIAIDAQKYERLTGSVEYWYESELYSSGLVIPGRLDKGREWAVVKGATCYGTNLSRDEAAKLATKVGVDPVFCGNNYVIYGMKGISFAEYKEMSLQQQQAAKEMIPLMDESGEQELRTPMWNNIALYNHAAWTVSGMNLGLSFMTFSDMRELQSCFTRKGRSVTAKWEDLAEWFSAKLSRKVEAAEVEAAWIWPKEVKNFQKQSFQIDNSKAPAQFRRMRGMTREIYRTSVVKATKGTSIDHIHPVTSLLETGLDEVLADIVSDARNISAYNGWQAEAIIRQMYFGYVSQAVDAANNKSQSERTQIDQVSSGSDQKQFLRAALGTHGFNAIESKDLPYLRTWGRTWRNALSIGVMEDSKKIDVLTGMMVLGLRALAAMAQRDTSAMVDGVNAVMELIEAGNTSVEEFLVEMGDWDAFQNYTKAFNNLDAYAESTGISKRELIEIHQRLKNAHKICKLESVQNLLLNVGLEGINRDLLEQAVLEESTELNAKVQDWVISDFFGALEEAHEDIGRQAYRQDGDALLSEVLSGASWGDSRVEEASTMINREFWKFLVAQAKENKVAMETDDILSFYAENRGELLPRFKQLVNPAIQACRLIEYANAVIPTHATHIDPTNAFDKLVWDSIYEYDEEGVAAIKSSVSFPLPQGLKEDLVYTTLASGYNVELLAQIPNLGKQPRDCASTVATRYGYIYLDSAYFQMAVDKMSAEAVDHWLSAQMICGTGHVTTADHLLVAYDIWAYKGAATTKALLSDEVAGRRFTGHDDANWFRPFWKFVDHVDGVQDLKAFKSNVLDVQHFFMSCYSHVPVITMGLNASAHEARVEAMAARGADYEEINFRLEWECTKSVFMPLFYGGKSKADSLFVGNPTGVRANPYQLYRHFGFVLAGASEEQQSRTPQPKVVSYMKETFGVAVGAYAQNANSGYGYQNARHSAGNPRERAQNTANFQRTISPKHCEGWTWNHDGTVNGFMDRYLHSDIVIGHDRGEFILPSPVETTLKALDVWADDLPQDAWKAIGHLCRLSPSLMFCINSIVDDGKVDLVRLEQMRASVKRQTVSSVRQLFRDAVRKKGFEMTTTDVEVVLNEYWDIDTMKTLILLYSKKGEK